MGRPMLHEPAVDVIGVDVIGLLDPVGRARLRSPAHNGSTPDPA